MVRVSGHAAFELLPVVVTVRALLFAMALVFESDPIHEMLCQGVHGVVFARVATRTLSGSSRALVRFMAYGTELVVGHAALGRAHAVTVRASHTPVLGMPPMRELQASVPYACCRAGPEDQE